MSSDFCRLISSRARFCVRSKTVRISRRERRNILTNLAVANAPDNLGEQGIWISNLHIRSLGNFPQTPQKSALLIFVKARVAVCCGQIHYRSFALFLRGVSSRKSRLTFSLATAKLVSLPFAVFSGFLA